MIYSVRNNLKLYEEFNSSPIILEKLKRVAFSIAILCNGEYGEVFYNESQNHIFVNLGDSNPFNDEYLKSYIEESVVKDYSDQKNITVTIENECSPNTNEKGWVAFTFKNVGESMKTLEMVTTPLK